jgi:hypothetical protein
VRSKEWMPYSMADAPRLRKSINNRNPEVLNQ